LRVIANSKEDSQLTTTLGEIRTSKLRAFGPVLSGNDERKRTGRLYVSHLGLPDDEHDLTFHGGIDKAIHQYYSNQMHLLDRVIRLLFTRRGPRAVCAR
jgi:MOSC domain-containing protein YiiM